MSNKTDRIDTPAITLIAEKFFLNTKEILKVFNVTRTTFNKWKKLSSFPKPIYLTSRPIWKTQEILDWADKFKNPTAWKSI